MANSLISAQEINDAIAPLDEEQRALVIDFARLLAQRNRLRVPAVFPLEGPAYVRWSADVAEHAHAALAEYRRKVQDAGLPADGDLLEVDWPDDMQSNSATSVET